MFYPIKFFCFTSIVLFSIISTSAGQGLQLKEAFPNLKFDMPVEFVPANDGSQQIFIVEQKGIIKVFKNDSAVKETEILLDISKKVKSGGERGLLGLALHPDFKNNGYFYVNYTSGKSNLRTHISRFKAIRSGNKSSADSEKELIILTYDQPYGNHNGGKIAFGPDGYLYISAGDGGSGGDPHNNGQSLNTLLGKLIRIDVDHQENKLPYAIPQDNPLKNNNKGYKEEIFAYGLRNVWKFNFDRKTGEIWAGDVGQNEREEVHIIEKGGNYGWKIMEGKVCFENNTCQRQGLKMPIHEYLHKEGIGQSITGGYVYRGIKIKDMDGVYIYGDYASGNIWKLNYDGEKNTKNELITKLRGAISTFGEDEDGEIYVCSYGNGKIYKLVNE